MAVPTMTSWDQRYIVICATVLCYGAAAVVIAPLYALPVVLFCASLLVFLRAAVVTFAEFDEMREQLDSVNRRTARIEGRLGMARADDADAGPQSEP